VSYTDKEVILSNGCRIAGMPLGGNIRGQAYESYRPDLVILDDPQTRKMARSAEQMRKAPDKDAAEVLRRVTGLSVSDGKYVFVRGLGERYSSTEVDGVRIASPEQNKRVVPLDMLPASLLENVVVQKTYTADRPGEFGGGDVQVHTRDFPGNRTWSYSASQGYAEGVTSHARLTYSGSRADLFGFGAKSRGIPGAILEIAGNRKLDQGSFTRAQLAEFGKSFRDVWSPTSARTIPNANYSATYGDELRLFGRSLGLIESWSLSRSFDQQDESQRLFRSSSGDTIYDYAVQRATESVQLGGISGLSYRLSPRHSLHLRGLYTNSADDEVRTYVGQDHNRTEAISDTWLTIRNTRLMYVQRSLLSGTLEGQHNFARLLGADLDWKLTRSRAKRLQPDRRESVYDRRYYFPGDTAHWNVGSVGRREFGDLRDDGWGTTLSAAVPWHLGRFGSGRFTVGYDRQTKQRDNLYRRFDIYYNARGEARSAPPESIFGPRNYDGTPGTGYVDESTKNDRVYSDNYRAHQSVNAGYVNADVPFGRRLRGGFGVRVERGFQDVQSFDLFNPGVILQEGRLENTDWLPAANLTWAATGAINVRLAASRTLSRPDLNELSPSPLLEYAGGFQKVGNPGLRRARIENYDLRIEAFPSLSEVFAAGVFYKRLYGAIENVVKGAAEPILRPRNSDEGHNLGVELEARSGLGRLWNPLRRLSLNANASFISSQVRISELSQNGSERHPLQGQQALPASRPRASASHLKSHDMNGSVHLPSRIPERKSEACTHYR